MATETRFYHFIKPEGTDMYDVDVFNANADSIDSYIHQNADHIESTQDMLAPKFDTHDTYAIGDVVTYNNGIYIFKTAHAAGSWDASEVDRFYVTGDTLITGTLTAGQTSITLSSDYITTDSVLEFYTSIYGVNPVTATVTAGQVELTFSAQSSNMVVAVIVKIVR